MSKHAVMIANIASRRKPRGLRRAIRKYKPVLVVLSEAYHADAFLRQLARDLGYRYERLEEAGKDATVAVLVPLGLPWVYNSAVSTGNRWWFRDNHREPRLYARGRVVPEPRRPLRYFGVHLEPHGPEGRNAPEWRASMRFVDAWLDHKPNVPSIALGDFNGTAAELREFTNHRVYAGGKVDHFIARGIRDVDVKRLLTPPGMHGWFVMTFRLAGDR